MSKKRTSAESNDDEQQNEGSDSLFQQGNYAKRAKLASLSDTTLQDLPMELIEFILIKVVVMEVEGMKLAKSVWKEKADSVINRLGTVCSYWSSILTSTFFRNELHRTLDTTAPGTIRLEILHQCQIPYDIYQATTMKDEIFMISRETENIIVYNRSNMTRLKDIIAPPETTVLDIAGCNVSNCVYVLDLDVDDKFKSVFSMQRMTKGEDHRFNFTPWINCQSLRFFPSISVSANGSLIIFLGRQGENPSEASIYDANGQLQRKIMFPDVLGFRLWQNAILKSNGNLLFVSPIHQFGTELSEIDTTGAIQRKYKSSVGVQNAIHLANISGRYVIIEWINTIKLLDSELNLLDFTGPQLNGNRLHYSSERNEVVSISPFGNNASVLTIFHFTEE